MIDIIVTLVFSIVMLVFMAYPAMILSNKINNKISLTNKSQTNLTIFLTILFSLVVGIFLKYY